MRCEGKDTLKHEGRCRLIDCKCPTRKNPVCGQNNNTYDNYCILQCLGVEFKNWGKCTTNCNCSNNTNYVCGKDGVTYKNRCIMKCNGA